jgi:hypothetical protein
MSLGCAGYRPGLYHFVFYVGGSIGIIIGITIPVILLRVILHLQEYC